MFRMRPDFTRLPISVTQRPRLSARLIVEIDSEFVRRTTRSGGRETEWCAPLRGFDSVNLYADTRYSLGAPSILGLFWKRRLGTVFTVALWHSNSSQPVAVWCTGSTFVARRAWRDLAQTLGLPAIETSPAGYAVREAGDFETSLRNLAAEGKVAVPRVGLNRPQPGIETNRDGVNTVLKIGSSPQRHNVTLTPENLICSTQDPFWGPLQCSVRLDSIRAIVVPAAAAPLGEEDDITGTGLIDRNGVATLNGRRIPGSRQPVWAIAGSATTEVLIVSSNDEIVISSLLPGEADWLAKLIMAAVADELPERQTTRRIRAS